MAFDYAELRDGTVKELFDEFGQDVTVSLWSAGTYNPTTGTATPVYTAKTVRGVVLDFGRKEIDGTQVQVGDKKLIAHTKDTSGASYTPDTHARVTVGGAVHEVVRVMPLTPAGTDVLYTLQLRGV